MKKQIEELVEQELKKATEEHGPFNSTHEGWAIMREEVLELEADLEYIQRKLGDIDLCIRYNSPQLDIDSAEQMYTRAINAATEAIQVAAMAKRYIIDFGE